MNTRTLSMEKDLPKLQEFWTQKGLPKMPPHYLPPTGLVVEHDGALICGAFLVKSDAKLASIACISANPKVDKHLRSEALDLLILELVEVAKQSGFDMITAGTNVPALQARYRKLGFAMTDENVIHYAGRI